MSIVGTLNEKNALKIILFIFLLSNSMTCAIMRSESTDVHILNDFMKEPVASENVSMLIIRPSQNDIKFKDLPTYIIQKFTVLFDDFSIWRCENLKNHQIHMPNFFANSLVQLALTHFFTAFPKTVIQN